MWYCLRGINHWGSGCLDLEYAIKELIDKFGYSRSSAYRVLNASDGTFWGKKPHRKFNRLQVEIHGLHRVAKYFGFVADTSLKLELRSL